MKILLVAEKEGTAIHKLCVYTKRANPHHDFIIVCVHPKRPSNDQLDAFEKGMAWADVIDFRYWKTAELLRSMFAINKPNLLTHYNPYDLERANWDEYGTNIVVNTTQQRSIKVKSRLIPLPVDVFYWDYQEEKQYKENLADPAVIMVANRIEGKKGILEVARVTNELGIKMHLVGAVSDPDYFDSVMENPNVEFHRQISDEELRNLYYKSSIHICNSIDNFESGTMPILESMACGVPVLTRKVGHVGDLSDGTNLVIRSGESSDLDDLKDRLQEMLGDPEWLLKLRKNAWQTVKNRNIEVYGLQYSLLYHELFSRLPLVSVIIPTADRSGILMKTLAHLITCDYQNLEIIVCDDSSTADDAIKNYEVIKAIREQGRHTIKYFRTALFRPDHSKSYGLARARNLGIIEAEGRWLMFLDDRFSISSDAISKFVSRRKEKVWLWGIKDGFKKGFVENFSFIDRKSIIKIGMFNTSIDQYGGMSQDCRSRAEMSDIKFENIEEATATSLIKSSNRIHKNADIAKSKIQCYKLYGKR